MKIYKFCGNVSELREVINVWIKECNVAEIEMDLDEKIYEADLQKLVDNPDSDLLILKNDLDEIIGFMGLQVFDSPLGNQRITNEHYWFVMPKYRGITSIRFLKTAQDWAKEKGCSHIVLNASYMASNLHDRVCRLYERYGANKFETSYIVKI